MHLAQIWGFPGDCIHIWEPKGGQYQSKHVIRSYGYKSHSLQNLTNNIGNLSLLLLKPYRSETKVVIFWTTSYFCGPE